ncbi:class I SAM-dependent methyltransferase [Solitalea sp. MAHUQ-68]|uniref:Class I SAM-dependent methyltransferase n=1 Tax=Solitalea agri TaxID=2953739 RepID=A0A9X2JG37_9SPHI|nr:class I SAM-dependent methyltransferase [Solitalea agri]MCO4294041.1 class I SAM-dependent methyltransferase [Solitalea agri]
MSQNLIDYYKIRATEYESIYTKPERQSDLIKTKQFLKTLFTNKAILEIACGTGYWTETIAETACSIVATDINQTVIDIAKTKTYTQNNVQFKTADFYSLKSENQYEALFGGFIWSHILTQELDKFISRISRNVAKGGKIVLMDNNFVEGSNTPVSKTDELGNTFQTRSLSDGSTHLILKNFPTAEFLREKAQLFSKDIEVIELEYFWVLIFTV